MAHIAARCYDHYLQHCAGSTLTCVPDPAALPAALAEVRPTQFFAVPRIWDKLAASGRGAPQLGLDRCRQAITGAAPTPPATFGALRERGVELTEIWGMSEIAGVGTYRPHGTPGSVGTPLPGLEARIADDGELLVRGAQVMSRYRNRPAATAKAIDADGWLHTGDVAEWTGRRELKIVDRKKELLITAGAKNVAPAIVEAYVKGASPLIAHAVAVGDGRPYIGCLVVLDPDVAAHTPDVEAEVARAMQEASARLSRAESPRRWTILPDQWAAGSDELTPTLKLRRRNVMARYASEVEALYQ